MNYWPTLALKNETASVLGVGGLVKYQQSQAPLPLAWLTRMFSSHRAGMTVAIWPDLRPRNHHTFTSLLLPCLYKAQHVPFYALHPQRYRSFRYCIYSD